MDHGSGTRFDDWYADRAPTSFDRGIRNRDVINYYDGGDPRANPATAPTGLPQGRAGWLSPAPDGVGRWVWGDSNHNTGMWIDTSRKHGFVTVPSFSSGRAWYGNSTLNTERMTFEMQVFDPTHFGEVIRGIRQPFNVQPSNRWPLTLPGLGACNAVYFSVRHVYSA
jgi:hypothetical protein